MTTAAREATGDLVSRVLSPVVAVLSHARHARMFHPDGLTFLARVEPTAETGPLSHHP